MGTRAGSAIRMPTSAGCFREIPYLGSLVDETDKSDLIPSIRFFGMTVNSGNGVRRTDAMVFDSVSMHT